MLLHADRVSAGTPSLQWEIENALGDFYTQRQQTRQAETWYRKSIDVFETQRSTVQDEELKLPFFANGDGLYQDYADLLIRLGRSDEALELLDFGRSRTLEEGLNPAKSSSHTEKLHPPVLLPAG